MEDHTQARTDEARGHTPGPWVVDPDYPLSVRPTLPSQDPRHPGPAMVGATHVADLAQHFTLGKHARAVTSATAYYGRDPRTFIVDPDTAKANARLIAAAPDMLEVLEEASQFLANLSSTDPEAVSVLLERMQAATDKAKKGAR